MCHPSRLPMADKASVEGSGTGVTLTANESRIGPLSEPTNIPLSVSSRKGRVLATLKDSP
jgi:hypothetical protein